MTDKPKQEFTYPIIENTALVQESEIQRYLWLLFGQVFWKKHHFINLRGVGEKNTPREGHFQEDGWLQPGLFDESDEYIVSETHRHCHTWSAHHVAGYIVPAVLKEARGTAQAVDLFTAVLLDLDSGDTNAKAQWLEDNIGTPTMVVASGGTTELGTPKLHVYYCLTEPTDEIGKVVDLRHVLAEKCGGDLSLGRGTPDNPLGRAHQPIRIPGSVHAKGGRARPVQLLFSEGPAWELEVLGHAIRAAKPGPFAVQGVAAPAQAGRGWQFGPELNQRPDIADALLQPVHEGGEGERTRWGEFNRVAGHYIRMVREGRLSLDEAKGNTSGWMLSSMVPPWPLPRFEKEWHGLLNTDMQKNGAMPAPQAHAVEIHSDADVEKLQTERRLKNWAMYRWTQTEAPPREFIVDELVLAGKPHLVVAEGGAGKTFAMLELALKVASMEPEEELSWLGKRVRGAGAVVMITTEDDADELHRRIQVLDPTGRRFKAGERLIVMPTLNAGGGFSMAERTREGKVAPSVAWAEILAQLRLVKDLKMVVVDTLNSTLHGEENSATVINEYMRMIHPVCGEMGAALVLTHHIGKQNKERGPIQDADDMFTAIRGSSALPAAFRVVLGLWHCHDYAKRMKALALEPAQKMLWRFGVLKANNPEMMREVAFLLRNQAGLLEDVTTPLLAAGKKREAQLEAWLLAAIQHAGDKGMPYYYGSKNMAGTIQKRKNELAPVCRELSDGAIQGLVRELLEAGEVVLCAAKGSRQRNVLDVPSGPFATNEAGETIAQGALPVVNWEAEYRFDVSQMRVVPVSEPHFKVPGRG